MAAAAVIQHGLKLVELSYLEVDAAPRAMDSFISVSSMREAFRARIRAWPSHHTHPTVIERVAQINLEAMRILDVEFSIRTP